MRRRPLGTDQHLRVERRCYCRRLDPLVRGRRPQRLSLPRVLKIDHPGRRGVDSETPGCDHFEQEFSVFFSRSLQINVLVSAQFLVLYACAKPATSLVALYMIAPMITSPFFIARNQNPKLLDEESRHTMGFIHLTMLFTLKVPANRSFPPSPYSSPMPVWNEPFYFFKQCPV